MEYLKYIPKVELDRVLSLDIGLMLKAELFAVLCRINSLYMISAAGSGHIGSSFSSMDIVAWLYLSELGVDDQGNVDNVYFSSKGHDVPGLYSVLIGSGIIDFDMLHQLRKIDGLPGHPDIKTPGIITNTGSVGMGISKAKGIIAANRLTGKNKRIFVMTGDGELQEGQIWESLISAANRSYHELTVIVDYNKLQSDIWVSQTSGLGDIESKFKAFGWHTQRIDGHDFNSISSSLLSAGREKTGPSVIIADTIKGRGVSFLEHNVPPEDRTLYQYHSGALTKIEYGSALTELEDHLNNLLGSLNESQIAFRSVEFFENKNSQKKENLVKAYSQLLLEQGKKKSELVVLDADLKLDCGLIPFEETFPERFLECGIAEQDMVSQAGGLALSGYLPVVHSFASFLSMRANEQIYNNATERTKIIYCGFLSGLLPAGPGHSHQSVRDIAVLSSIPGLFVVQPCCESEVEKLVDYCFNNLENSCYIRFTSIPVSTSFKFPDNYSPDVGKGCLIKEGDDA